MCRAAVKFAKKRVIVQLENTPKAFANSSPGLEREARQPWEPKSKYQVNPERVSGWRTLNRVQLNVGVTPKVLAALEPWAEIGERLGRIFKLKQYPKKVGELDNRYSSKSRELTDPLDSSIPDTL